MKIIWQYAPISTTEVIEKLVKTSTWSLKTTQTMLLRLVKKGALTYEKSSRVFVYTSLIKEKEYVATESRSFLNRFYNGTLNSMVLNFLENDKLSEDDTEELREILNKRTIKKDR
ncbi:MULTISPECIES: BlaI/MecI/CopY family transcriptional regulator [unclassified Clostridioides]|nr:BlaI/MecI/CopY family transcriptional regulator [Clostridioides sp. ES-S-0171-01]MCC0686511.1 BlaI/MecI/CopY family transcriptional regulator [Clostridioides sp. ES-S-0056-01]MCC0713968.1 BlaI/MecI/CopY family transcriptional regulator [Clostridioides sp. ES-S-0077-01]UDN55098.1 BlaI/MecI/CopY family transcriptional regulator [Clostridioides sp. ES-S-0054-01]